MIENKKSKIWVYAVILFMSAFIVLLFTAYSQIKLNKNLNDYKNQVYNKETEKNKYQQNFSSAQEMNAKLNEEIDKLKEENKSLKYNLENLKSDKYSIERLDSLENTAMAGLSTALTSYLNGNVVECAGLLNGINAAYLNTEAMEAYNILKTKVYAEAGKLLFNEGFSLYNRSKFSEAAEKLLLSVQYAPAEAYSDKCLFYLAYSEVKNGNTARGLEHMNDLIKNYPSSKYMKSAKRFVVRYQQ